MTKENVTFSLNALYYQISFFFNRGPFFLRFLLAFTRRLVLGDFLRPENAYAGFPSDRGAVA